MLVSICFGLVLFCSCLTVFNCFYGLFLLWMMLIWCCCGEVDEPGKSWRIRFCWGKQIDIFQCVLLKIDITHALQASLKISRGKLETCEQTISTFQRWETKTQRYAIKLITPQINYFRPIWRKDMQDLYFPLHSHLTLREPKQSNIWSRLSWEI